MIVKVTCPRCKKTAFEYYVSDFRYEDGKDEGIILNKVEKCKHCGHKITKIGGNYEKK